MRPSMRQTGAGRGRHGRGRKGRRRRRDGIRHSERPGRRERGMAAGRRCACDGLITAGFCLCTYSPQIENPQLRLALSISWKLL